MSEVDPPNVSGIDSMVSNDCDLESKIDRERADVKNKSKTSNDGTGLVTKRDDSGKMQNGLEGNKSDKTSDALVNNDVIIGRHEDRKGVPGNATNTSDRLENNGERKTPVQKGEKSTKKKKMQKENANGNVKEDGEKKKKKKKKKKKGGGCDDELVRGGKDGEASSATGKDRSDNKNNGDPVSSGDNESLRKLSKPEHGDKIVNDTTNNKEMMICPTETITNGDDEKKKNNKAGDSRNATGPAQFDNKAQNERPEISNVQIEEEYATKSDVSKPETESSQSPSSEVNEKLHKVDNLNNHQILEKDTLSKSAENSEKDAEKCNEVVKENNSLKVNESDRSVKKVKNEQSENGNFLDTIIETDELSVMGDEEKGTEQGSEGNHGQAKNGNRSGDKVKGSGDKTSTYGDKASTGGDKSNDSGDKANGSGDKVNESGDQASGSEDKAKDSGDKANGSGDKANGSGDNANVSGYKVNVSGDKVNVSRDKVNVSGDKANKGGEKAKESGDKSSTVGDKASCCGDKESGTGDEANGSGDKTNISEDKGSINENNRDEVKVKINFSKDEVSESESKTNGSESNTDGGEDKANEEAGNVKDGTIENVYDRAYKSDSKDVEKDNTEGDVDNINGGDLDASSMDNNTVMDGARKPALHMTNQQLLQRLQEQTDAMTRLQDHTHAQQVKSHLLTTSLRAKLRRKDQELKLMQADHEQQVAAVISHLLYLEGQMQKEQNEVYEVLCEKNDIIRRQKAAIEDLVTKNNGYLQALKQSHGFAPDNGLMKPQNHILKQNETISIQDHGNKVILRDHKIKNGEKTQTFGHKVRFSAMKDRLRRHKSSLELYQHQPLETLKEKNVKYGSEENLVAHKVRSGLYDRKERCRSLIDYPVSLFDVDEGQTESPDSCFSDDYSTPTIPRHDSTSSLVSLNEKTARGNGGFPSVYGFNELSKSRSVPHGLPTVVENDASPTSLKGRPHSLPSVELLAKDILTSTTAATSTSVPSPVTSPTPSVTTTSSSPPSESNPFKSFKNVFKRKGSKKKRAAAVTSGKEQTDVLKQHFNKYDMT